MEHGGPTGGHVVTVFRSRLRDDAGEQYAPVAERMLQLARSMPGFVDFKTFTADDGERVSIIVFDSIETHDGWRDHPEHRRAQELGRARFYESYRIQACALIRQRDFRV
jgi:heme-degrading monooxygenase HmoA